MTALMAIDLSAAFDTINHSILISLLRERFGITDTALSWFKSYLCPQYCKVNVGTTYSKNRELVCCFPQGSCASPIFYTVYTSTMESVVETQTSNHEEVQSSHTKVTDPKDKAMEVALHGFADDQALKNTFLAKSRHAEQDSVSLWKLKQWMPKY